MVGTPIKTPRLRRRGATKYQRKRADLLRSKNLCSVGLRAGGGVLVNHAGLDRPIHRRGVLRSGVLGRDVLGRNQRVEALTKGLEPRLDPPITFGEAQGFAGGFDSRFSVSHDRSGDENPPKTQTRDSESRVLSKGLNVHVRPNMGITRRAGRLTWQRQT